jgi:hypothetical protein
MTYEEELTRFVEEHLGPIEERSEFKVSENGDTEAWFRIHKIWHHVKIAKSVFAIDGVVYMSRQ